jgi:SAM-dependent methyltransferase
MNELAITAAQKWQIVCDEMAREYPVLAGVWQQAADRFGEEWLPESVRNVEAMYGPIERSLSSGVREALNGYAEFANDSMRNQVLYEKTGRYRASNYEEVRRDCYHNEAHMTQRYLPGMWLSHFVWPQHYHMLRAFESGVLPRVRRSQLFFEVGVGCGMYSKRTLELLPQVRGVGFDISQYALDFTGKVLEAFGVRDRYTLENRDISLGYPVACDFMICQEVLEHLEDPATFCRWLCDLVRPGGHAYITAALNAAHSDHIYLFRAPAELEQMLRDAGFQPLHSQEECAPGFKPRHKTPSLCGYFCVKV